MAQQQLRNDQFFDAPVELFFTVNLAMGIGTKMDSAMMIQKTMITTKARSLDTYPQPTSPQAHKPTSRMESFSCDRVEYTWCCTGLRIGLRHGTTGLCGS